MILGVAAFACLAVIFVLLLFVVYKLRPKTFKVKATVTKWISVEVELESPEPVGHDLSSSRPVRQQQTEATAATAAPDDDRNRPASAA
jgi:hypothetical protein